MQNNRLKKIYKMGKLTIAQLEKENKDLKLNNVRLVEKYDDLLEQSNGLKHSFTMIKNNYEREKNRLDKVIDSLLNITKK